MRRRVARVRWAALIARTQVWAALLVAGVVLGGRLWVGWQSGEWIVALVLLSLWLGVLSGFAFFRLPATAAALRQLDERGNWKDRFASAWEYLGKPTPEVAEQLHLERSHPLLPEAHRTVSECFAMPKLRRAWVLPALALLLSCLPLGRILPDARDLALTEAMKEAARAEAENLRRETERVLAMEAMTEAEQAELEALRTQVDAVAEALADPEGLTAGEMLEALDERARAAERLASQLGAGTDAWASPEMLAEMANHADTAQLAVFIGDKAAEEAAAESTALAVTLADPALTSEVQERFTRATDRISSAARDEDHVRPIGERFGNAARKLQDAQARTAAREFEELAKWFRDLSSREKAQQQLESLADTLREAGGEIGNNELKKMEQLAGAGAPGSPTPDGLKGIDSGAAPQAPPGVPGMTLAQENAPQAPGQLPVPGQSPTEQPGAGQSPVPGSTPGEQESGDGKNKGEQAFSAPIPGEQSPDGKSGSGLGQSDQARDGKGKGGMLSAPIPGMNNDAPVPGAGLAGREGQSNQSGTGGDQAGTGTAELFDDEGEALKASSDVKVVARQGEEGDSSVRAVEGEVKAEAATRSQQDIVAEFIAVEEQALDEESLPLSRRRHVLRYFTAVRKQFEKAESTPPAP